MTLEDMVLLNRTAEKVAQLGYAPPNKEAYAVASDLIAIIDSVKAEIKARHPQHTNDVAASNVVHLMRVRSMTAIVDSALAFFEANGSDPHVIDVYASEQLITAVRNYKLIHTMPVPADDNPQPE